MLEQLLGDSKKINFGKGIVKLPKAVYDKLSDSEKKDLSNHNKAVAKRRAAKKTAYNMAKTLGRTIGKEMRKSSRRRRY
ncbi:MAG: hypothetical protein JNL75_11165 [Chitinophagales bacterium]|nr:hypothetical protein [Chitinophagales bacterium]